MFEPRILRKGPFHPAAFDLVVTGERWQPGAEYDALVETAWQGRIEAAAARGHRLWDGTHYRFTDIAQASDGLRIDLGTVPFRYLATYRLLHKENAARGLTPTHHISTASMLRTADGHYVFGKRAINGAIDLIGGGFQPEDGVPVCFENNLYKEIAEELGVARADLGEPQGIGIVRSTTSNVLVIAKIETTLTREGILAAFAHRDDDEMAEPVFVPESNIRDYLRSLTDYRVLMAELLN
ncbi:MAG: hypothetical protein JSR60_05680 [Proteobacteria bacterium]|nr:hypothetical protein [Pseudomonadota bacterium]